MLSFTRRYRLRLLPFELMRPYRLLVTLTTQAFLCAASVVAAQSQKASYSDSSRSLSESASPQFSGGVTAGAMAFSGGRNEQALSLLLQFRPQSWLLLSAAPGFGRTTFGTLSSTGLTDIPFASVARYAPARSPWSPTFFGSLSTVLSTGQSGTPLGIGRTSVAVGAGLSVSPIPHTYLSADASRPVTAASGNGAADFWISRSLGRATPSLGYSTEIGTADSAARLSRSIAGGIAFLVSNPVSLAFDGSHGLTGGAPKWTFSVSLGSAFSGISPMSGGSIFGRMKNAFGSRATSSSGYSKTSGAGTGCRKLGTC